MSNFVRRELVGQQVEQLGVRRRIVGMVQVERVDEAAAHHQRPEPVGDVAPELRVVRRWRAGRRAAPAG